MNSNMNRSGGFGASVLGAIALGGVVATTLLCAASAPARADAGKSDVLDLSGFERVTDDSLGGLRGGFRVGSFDLNFGVTMSTSVNGQQILQTVFNAGQDTTTTQAPTGGWTFTPVDGGFQATSGDGTSITQRVGQSIDTDITNSADNRVIQNNMALNLFINNLSQIQAQASTNRLLTNMANDINSHAVLGN